MTTATAAAQSLRLCLYGGLAQSTVKYDKVKYSARASPIFGGVVALSISKRFDVGAGIDFQSIQFESGSIFSYYGNVKPGVFYPSTQEITIAKPLLTAFAEGSYRIDAKLFDVSPIVQIGYATSRSKQELTAEKVGYGTGNGLAVGGGIGISRRIDKVLIAIKGIYRHYNLSLKENAYTPSSIDMSNYISLVAISYDF